MDGFPSDIAGVDLVRGAAWLQVDDTVYPLEALYGACYVFIDRCFVLVDRPTAGRYRVSLASKAGDADEATLRALVGEFVNELLSCAWRHQITKDNRASLEAVAMQALAGAMGPPSLDDLKQFDFSEEPFEDPLGIGLSWEEKYKKKAKEGTGGAGGEGESK